MRASVDRVREVAIDAVEAARDQADGLVGSTAGRIVAGIDGRANQIASGIDQVADHAPVVSVEVPARRSGRPLKIAIVAVVVAVVAYLVVRRLAEPDAGQEGTET